VIDERFAFGLRIASELELPELAAAEGAGVADLTVRIGRCPAVLTGARRVGTRSQVLPDQLLFEQAGVARYLAHAGSEIVIEPVSGAEPSHIRTFLLGAVLAGVCYQRGLTPLHANAIAPDGRAIAFTGPSGSGKSTLGGYLAAAGHPVLADDVCVLGHGPDGRIVAWPGVRRLKLWRDTLTALGHSADRLDRVVGDRDKYVVPLTPADLGPTPFARLYVLERAEAGAPGGISQLAGAAAMQALTTGVYRLDLGAAMGRREAVFAQAVAVLRQASVYRFERRWGLDELPAEARRLQRHFQAPPP
jgi:energy-coupling factor transporter ATP-binding protein EcfA2